MHTKLTYTDSEHFQLTMIDLVKVHYIKLLIIAVCLCVSPKLANAQAPTADFEVNITSLCETGGTVSFTNLSSGDTSATVWSWDLGNGNNSAFSNPKATYSLVQSYTVSLTGCNGGDCDTETKTGYITVHTDPIANFSVDTTKACYPVDIEFIESSVVVDGAITNYHWDFGDGTSLDGMTTSNTKNYFSAGTRDPNLTITDEFGCTSFYPTGGNDITINIAEQPTSFFTIQSDSTACANNLDVTFNNTSTGTGTLFYNWDFGDDTKETISGQGTSLHSYSELGYYDVTLVITTDGKACYDSITRSEAVRLQIDTIEMNTTQDTLAGCPNSIISFLIESNNPQTTALWTFPTKNMAGLTPDYSFTDTGTVNISLKTTNEVCTTTIVRPFVLKSFIANFSADDPNSCNIPHTVNFTNESAGDIVNYEWTFGTGDSAFTESPSYAYTNSDTFDVQLKITDATGCTSTTLKEDFVLVMPIIFKAHTQGLDSVGCIQKGVTWDVVYRPDSIPITNIEWNFMDGTVLNNTDLSANHTYDSTGTIYPEFTLTNAENCSFTFIDTLTLGDTARFDLTLDINVGDTICASQEIGYLNNTPKEDNMSWIFAHSYGYPSPHSSGMATITSISSDPLMLLRNTGWRNISVEANHNECKTDTVMSNQVFVLGPVSRFNIDPTDCEDGLTISVNDTSIDADLDSYVWDWGDGNTTGGQSQSHTYASTGDYTLSLTTANAVNNCVDSISTNVIIRNPSASFVADTTIGCTGMTVKFTASNTDQNDIFQWYITNLKTGTIVKRPSTDENILDGFYLTDTLEHTFSNVGYYSVRLRTGNLISGCLVDSTLDSFIHIIDLYPGFIIDTLNGCKNFDVTLTDTSSSDTTIAQLIWNFNDPLGSKDTTLSLGTTSSFTYVDASVFGPSLTLVDVIGCSKTVTNSEFIRTTWPTPAFATNIPITCYGDTVEMRYTGGLSGPGDSLIWKYDDGTAVDTFAGKTDTARHVFINGGMYGITLIGIDKNGCVDSIIDSIEIQEPVAHFYLNESDTNFKLCPPLDVQFHADSSSADITSLKWSFGDGGSTIFTRAQADLASRSYIRSGFFDVNLIGTSDLGCIDTVIIDSFIQINGPIVTLTLDTLEGCTGMTVNFSYISNDNITSYKWDFGDGTVTDYDTTIKVVNYTYNTAGAYTPAYYVYDTLDPGEENCDYRIPYDSPIYIHGLDTDFDIAGNEGCTPFDISFTDQVTFDELTYDSIATGIAAYEWYFDSANISAKIDTSSSNDPTYTYDTSGSYSIKLVIVDSMGCRDSFTIADTIQGLGSYSNASLDTFTGCAPLTINFTNTSESDGTITSTEWLFGDGQTGSTSNIQHIYDLTTDDYVDTFTVQLITADDNGCNDTLIWTDSVHISYPKIKYNPIDTFICLGDTVFFQNKTNASGPSYLWDFGNGETSTSTNPIAQYLTDGLFNTKLVVTDTNGCMDSLEKSDYIDLQIPHASYTNDPMYKYCPDTSVTFLNNSTRNGNIAQWIWFYGDGESDTIVDGSNPTHTYTTAQKFDVRLKVITTGGCIDDTVKNEILNIEGPYAVYASNDTLGCKGLPINFNISTDSSNVATYKWIFGDGDSTNWSNGNAIHIYDSMGVYHPYLRINDGLICTLNVGGIDSVEIETIVADFLADTIRQCQDHEFELIQNTAFSNPSAANKWKFKFGDGTSTSYAEIPDTFNHTFAFAGDFDVTMYAKSGSIAKCKDTVLKVIHVDSLPIINTIPDDTICRGDTMKLQTSTAGTIVWTPNDSISQIDTSSPNIWPTLPTKYYITVTDDIGCINRDSVQISISGIQIDSLNTLSNEWGHQIDSGGCIPFTYNFAPSLDYSTVISSWDWNFGDGNSSNQSSITHTYTSRNNFNQSLIIRHGDNDKCIDTLTRIFFIDTLPVIRSIRNDSTICWDDTLLLYAEGEGIGSWQPAFSVAEADSHQTLAFPLDTTTYTFTLGNSSGCNTDTNIFVDLIFWKEVAELEAYPREDTTIAEGTEFVQFGTSITQNNLTYEWTPQESLTCYDCPNPQFIGDTAASYKLEVRDITGCVVVTEFVKLHFEYMFSSNLPQAFSPGTTPGENDTLFIRGWGIDEILEFRVYNRWGEMLYENLSGNPNDGWDGKFNGEYVPAGTYVITARTRSINDENGVQHDSEPIYRNLLIVR